jgi:hypothetical protein
LSQKSAAFGGGIAQSAPVAHGSPRPPELPLPVLALVLALLLDALALDVLVVEPPPDPPAPLLLDALLLEPPPDPPELALLLDAAPPAPEAEAEADEVASPLPDDVCAPVVEGPESPQPAAMAALPARTETSARHGAKKGTRGMIAIVPPGPDRPART